MDACVATPPRRPLWPLAPPGLARSGQLMGLTGWPLQAGAGRGGTCVRFMSHAAPRPAPPRHARTRRACISAHAAASRHIPLLLGSPCLLPSCRAAFLHFFFFFIFLLALQPPWHTPDQHCPLLAYYVAAPNNDVSAQQMRSWRNGCSGGQRSVSRIMKVQP